jgi:catechol 2,3-dioxygenase-like lactoylglutathione lyase family enzyme
MTLEYGTLRAFAVGCADPSHARSHVKEDAMMRGSAIVMTVTDIPASTAYYRDKLGFDVAFEYGKPTFYVCLCSGDVAVHLVAASQTKRLPGNGAVCIFVDDVDALHADLVKRGAKVLKEPKDYDYGMRDFDVADLDGNMIFFGMESKKPV